MEKNQIKILKEKIAEMEASKKTSLDKMLLENWKRSLSLFNTP
jgi:hypothetical protein